MRRAAIFVTCLVTFTFAGCNLYFDDDDDRKNRPHKDDPDASCGGGPGSPDGGFLPDGGSWPDGGTWPDGGFVPDASPDW